MLIISNLNLNGATPIGPPSQDADYRLLRTAEQMDPSMDS